MNLVVDTNIVFSAILNTNSRIANLLTMPDSGLILYAPTYLLSELVEHRQKLKKALKLSTNEILELTHLVTHRIHFVEEEQISSQNWITADQLTATVDSDDITFVALALELKCALWTGDKKLQHEISGIEILSTNLLEGLIKS
ncbi:MAG: putative toxin-antitoxin system toxin component, PIN family [Imperialibacter sp.]